MKNYLIFKKLAIIVTIIILPSCNTTEHDWKKTNEQNSIEAFTEFISKHPESNYATEAKLKIEQFEWENALKTKTITTYNEFVNKHPESKYVETAKQNIFDLEYTWKDGFLDKSYYGDQTNIKEAIQDLFDRCVVYSYQEISNGIIYGYGVGDENGNWSYNGEGGLVYVKRIKNSNYMIVGFKVAKGRKEASVYFHQSLAGKLAGEK